MIAGWQRTVGSPGRSRATRQASRCRRHYGKNWDMWFAVCSCRRHAGRRR